MTPFRDYGVSLRNGVYRRGRESYEVSPFYFSRQSLLRDTTDEARLARFGLRMEDLELSDAEKAKICKDRKERREVLSALKKLGGNHKKPTYTIKSLVRC